MKSSEASTVTPALPRKNLLPGEREFLKRANRMLLDKPNGRIGSAAFMDIVADWHGFRGDMKFGDYAARWVAEGNAKNKHADKMLRDLLGLNNEPDPRKAA